MNPPCFTFMLEKAMGFASLNPSYRSLRELRVLRGALGR
jgi:hypothetical protein